LRSARLIAAAQLERELAEVAADSVRKCARKTRSPSGARARRDAHDQGGTSTRRQCRKRICDAKLPEELPVIQVFAEEKRTIGCQRRSNDERIPKRYGMLAASRDGIQHESNIDMDDGQARCVPNRTFRDLWCRDGLSAFRQRRIELLQHLGANHELTPALFGSKAFAGSSLLLRLGVIE
jgi:hypothetical protein